MWTDLYGVIIRLEITPLGKRHDRGIYNDCDPFLIPESYFGAGDMVSGDLGFQGPLYHIAFPFKRGQDNWFELHTQLNKDIRKKRIPNEWPIGLIKNHFRTFLGSWPVDDAYFPIFMPFAAHLINYRIRRSSVPPVPLDKMLEPFELYEKRFLL